MKRPDYDGVKKLNVEYEETDVGWIYLTMTIGENSYQTRFSEVYDPLLRFKSWLEAVCVGVDQCSFSFDTEGNDIKFDFENHTWKRNIFTVSEDYRENDEFFLSDNIDRKQLVEAFYGGFLDFCESPKFDRYGWEKISFAEHLTEMLELDYKTILIGLSHLGREQLSEWFDKATPLYKRNYPTGKERIELANQLKSELGNCEKSSSVEIQEIFNDAKLENITEIRNNYIEYVEIGELVEAQDGEDNERDELTEVGGIIDCWRIPLDFNNWKLAEKKLLVEDCLSVNCSGNEGTKIKDFKSKIIEDYLK